MRYKEVFRLKKYNIYLIQMCVFTESKRTQYIYILYRHIYRYMRIHVLNYTTIIALLLRFSFTICILCIYIMARIFI